ncbi:phosphatidate cytidylyltransferase [Derxia gummosa]|uniref:Phosphatidate cytidylyltransferase n=1 Tax=Derxia gummosa DSM 723 TaxID=1121388 RepID=A0A8B6X4A7_9BURK|nr:phosphatidate cytidylyltransferase [Derxia gummosa]
MLRTRVITALVLLAVVLPVAASGSVLAVAALALLATVAGGWEWTRLFSLSPLIVPAVLLVAGGMLVAGTAGALTFGQLDPAVTFLLLASVGFWLLQAPQAVLGARAPSWMEQRGLAAASGVLLLLAFLASVIALYERGVLTLLSAMVVVWVSDISAYFCGKRFGRHKLAPAVSPGKTWEGAIGAAVIVTLLALGWSRFATDTDLLTTIAGRGSALALAGVMLMLVALGIVGDLFESLLKRRAGIKDSSNLLPGHGGVLDRIDALLPVLPVAELLLRWLA